MTQDELDALKKACESVESFQTKTKIFEEGWKAHKEFLKANPTMMIGLRNYALERDFQLITALARDVSNARTSNEIYVARDRLRRALEYFKELVPVDPTAK